MNLKTRKTINDSLIKRISISTTKNEYVTNNLPCVLNYRVNTWKSIDISYLSLCPRTFQYHYEMWLNGLGFYSVCPFTHFIKEKRLGKGTVPLAINIVFLKPTLTDCKCVSIYWLHVVHIHRFEMIKSLNCTPKPIWNSISLYEANLERKKNRGKK